MAIGGAYPGARKGSTAMKQSALRAIWTCSVRRPGVGDGAALAMASRKATARAPMRAPWHRWTARQQSVRRAITYFARNLAHDLSCSFTNALPFKERSRSGGPKGSQACCGCTRWPLENWCVAAQFLALSWRKRAAASSSPRHHLQWLRAGSPRVGGICVHKYNVT